MGGQRDEDGPGLEEDRANASKSSDPFNARVAIDAKGTQTPARTARMGRHPFSLRSLWQKSRSESSSGACEHLRRLRLLRYTAVAFGLFGGNFRCVCPAIISSSHFNDLLGEFRQFRNDMCSEHVFCSFILAF